MTEVWIEARPGLEVSSLGRVRRYIEGHRDADGYLCVSGGKRGAPRVPIHKLVAEAFIGKRPAGKVIRHRNDNRDDNRLVNLAYGTRKDNAADAERNGKVTHLRGEKNLRHLQNIAAQGGAWWRGKKRDGVRGKAVD